MRDSPCLRSPPVQPACLAMSSAPYQRRTYCLTALVLAAVLLGHFRAAIAAETAIEVSPPLVRLDAPEATHQLLVSIPADDGRTVDVTRDCTFRSEDPAIATVDALGLVQPLRDGQT